MAEMPPVRVPLTWKAPLMTLRDTLTEDQGGQAIAALAKLTPEQIGTLTSALQHPETAISRLTAPHPQVGRAALPGPQPVLNHRPVPYSVAGLIGRILDLAQVEPARARDVLQRALKLG